MDSNLVEIIENTEIDLKEKRDAGIWKKASLWQPIVFKKEVYYENGGSDIEANLARLAFFPKDMNQETLIDVASNTGYTALNLAKNNNLSSVTCLDQASVLDIVDYIIANSDINNVNTIRMDYESDDFLALNKYDNVMCVDTVGNNVGEFDILIPRLIALANKRVWFQPTVNTNVNLFAKLLEYAPFKPRGNVKGKTTFYLYEK